MQDLYIHVVQSITVKDIKFVSDPDSLPPFYYRELQIKHSDGVFNIILFAENQHSPTSLLINTEDTCNSEVSCSPL